MWFKNWFSASKQFKNDFSFLNTDMHNHVLFGLDDGALKIHDSIQLITQMHELGFNTIIPSPHIMSHLYPNNHETIAPVFQSVKNAINAQLPSVQLPNFAAEYLIDEEFPILRKSKKLLPFYKNYILIEMSYVSKSTILEQEIYELQLAGYQPVLAHPERYTYLHHDFSIFENMVGRGCELQLNLLSLTNRYNKTVTKVAKKILQKQLYHWAGTDIHKLDHIIDLQHLCKSPNFNLIKNYPFLNNKIIIS